MRRLPSSDGTKTSLLVTLGGAAGPGVVLSAHTDVVPAREQAWTSDPFEATTRDGRVYGRGATDMKGFLAVVLAHLPAIAEAATGAPVHLAFSYDEEIGCRGAPDLVAAVTGLAHVPALAIVGEPTGLRVVRAHKGKVARRLTFTGRTGHSARPEAAANAVLAAAAVAHGLRGLAATEAAKTGDPTFAPPCTTVHVGSLHGGGALNLVPERATLEYEIRYLPGTDPAQLLAAVDALVDAERNALLRAAAEAGIAVEELSAYPGLDTAAQHPAVSVVARLAGDDGPPAAVSFGTEAGLYAAAGIPTVVCGPGDMARAHKPDEWIGLDELAAASRMMDRLVEMVRRPATEWMRE